MIPTRINPFGRWAETDILAYGCLYDPSNSSPDCQRIVMNGRGVVSEVSSFSNKFAHNTRRCMVDNLGTRHVNYYLDASDSTKKADGTSADLTGADGDVMVEFPVTYWRVTTRTDGKIEYLISAHYFPGASIHPFFYVGPGGNTVRTQYVGAYEATYTDADGNKLMTDETLSAPVAYAGTYKLRSLPGAKPATRTTLANFRTVANNNNGGKLANSLFYQYMVFFTLTDACSFNVKSSISVGFSYATAFNYAFTRLTGRCNYGNGTGDLLADPVQDAAITWKDAATEAMKIVQFQYRGIENLWGHVAELEEGIVKVDSGYYWTADDTKYSDSNYATDYVLKTHTWPSSSGWVKTCDNESFFATSTGGGSRTYLATYILIGSGERSCIRGGNLSYDLQAGIGSVNALEVLAVAWTAYGTRISC